MTMFSKLLIANRGEIARRVMRTAKDMGIKTVAVYSEADAFSKHVFEADQAFCIGAPAAAESYLRQEKIIDICKLTGAQAVHPGYGFLSENAEFSDNCAKNGISFVGPPRDAILSMGSKSESKIIMENANVPCTPGYHGEDQSVEKLMSEAERIGFPVMLKAVLGGGGKGMRIVFTKETLKENVEACQREAQASFGDSRILIERYLTNPRHIELQVFADTFGNVVHLFERDCSVQRRHQKVLEEAPAPFMPEALRQRMGQAAVNAAKAVGYVGAGTVEFMLDATHDADENSDFFFMEMNTRLQVEHPVTEMVTGLDLVKLQLEVAAGYPLPFTQDDLKLNGHAIEARVYAESPGKGFLPGVGTVNYMQQPAQGKSVRVDSAVEANDSVSLHYDPMISKLIVHAENRDIALKKMAIALADYHVAGLPTNIEFLKSCVDHEEFAKGGVDTSFIEVHKDSLLGKPPSFAADAHAAGIGLVIDAINSCTPGQPYAFRTHGNSERTDDFELFTDDGSEARNVTTFAKVIQPTAAAVALEVTVSTEDETTQYNIEGSKLDDQKYLIRIDNTTLQVNAVPSEHSTMLFTNGNLERLCFTIKKKALFAGEGSVLSGKVLTPPMPGKITAVLVKPGESVEKDQPLIIMEAMKMEHIMKAPKDGVVELVNVRVGDFVDDAKELCSFE